MSETFKDYTAWVAAMAQKIEADMRTIGRVDPFADAAVFLKPGDGVRWGDVVVSTDTMPAGCTDVIRFGPHGSAILHVPYSHVQSLLWTACRSMPVLGTHA